MKQYLLIPISEIDSLIEELNLDKNYLYESDKMKDVCKAKIIQLFTLKQIGEIVEQHNYFDFYEKQGFKLIKTINYD